MRSAFAKGLGVDESDVEVDFNSKTVRVATGGKDLDQASLEAALKATNKYSLAE